MRALSGTDCHQFSKELLKELIEHGHGQMFFKVETIKGQRTKLVIDCGKQYVFWFERTTIKNEEMYL